MNMAVWLVFWSAISILFYVYIGFSVLVLVTGRLLKKTVKKHTNQPSATLIIAAFNEENNISAKIENTLKLNYPAHKLEVIIASDGSTDATEEIATSYKTKGMELLSLPRRGKIFAINDAVSRSTGEILIFSDANTFFSPDAISMLLRNFADPEVGGVCGNQLYLGAQESDGSAKGEKIYWSFDKWLKVQESLTGSIVSADGAIYAIRRNLFKMPNSTAITDDFAISTSVIEQGYRLVFEPEAIAYEKTTSSSEDEFTRKVRIINRGLRGVLLRKKLLNPFKYSFYSLVLFTHKIMRRLVGVFLPLLLISNSILASKGVFYQIALICQMLFLISAIGGYIFRSKAIGQWKIFFIPFYYCLVNFAALSAVVHLIQGKRIEFWQPQRHLIKT